MSLQPESSRPRRLNVLCLDAGDLSSFYSSLLILKKIIQTIAHDNEEPPLPSTLFDYICGTFTGGLIALMLGRLDMSVDDAIKTYKEQKTSSLFNQPALRALFNKPLYNTSGVRDLVVGMAADAPMVTPDAVLPQRCKTFVVASQESANNAKPKLFRTYQVAKSPSTANYTILQAALATTAVQIYFKPAVIGDEHFLFDFRNNNESSEAANPSLCALEEIGDPKDIACFVSIGGGVPSIVSGPGTGGLGKMLAAMYRKCDEVHEKVSKKLCPSDSSPADVQYFRFPGPQLGHFTLDESEEVSLETSFVHTDTYLQSVEVTQKIKECALILRRIMYKRDTRMERTRSRGNIAEHITPMTRGTEGTRNT